MSATTLRVNRMISASPDYPMRYALLLRALLLILPLSVSAECVPDGVCRPVNNGQSSINVILEDGSTPLIEAIYKNRVDLVKEFIANGANPNFCGKNQCPLLAAVTRDTDIVKTLLLAGANPNIYSEKHSYSAIGHLANYKKEDISRYMAEGNFNGPMPDLLKSASLLISAGADINHVDAFGESPLRVSVRVNNVVLAKLLIKSGADLNYRRSPDFAFQVGDTILMEAVDQSVFCKSTELLQLLLESGADPNIRNEMDYDGYCEMRGGCGWRGYSPLTYAARHGYANIVSLLLQHGAEPNLPRTDGETALLLARKHRHPKTAAIIERHGGKLLP